MDNEETYEKWTKIIMNKKARRMVGGEKEIRKMK